MKRKELTLPTLVGLFVAVAGLISGLWLLQSRVGLGAKAVAEEIPIDVRITNISDSSFVISWTTERSVSGFVQYGEGENDPDLVVSDERDQQKGLIENYFTHFVIVRDLKPDTVYKLRVGSGKNLYDKRGEPYEVTTGPIISNPPAADVAYGTVTTTSGESADGSIVYIDIDNMIPQAALVKTTGSWVIPLSTARKSDLSGFAEYNGETEYVEINVVGGPMGKSKMVLTTADDSPVPNIILGQNYDLSTTSQSTESSPIESKFSTRSLSGITESTTVGPLVLLTPKFGEKVNNNRPVIIGEAPEGTKVTIEIRSDPVSGSAVAGNDGKFSFSVPSELPPGDHTVTVSAIIDGVNRTVSRSFTVYAAGETDLPFFTATPSGTTVPSPIPTKKPGPTAIPTPTKKPTPTAKPTPAVKLSPTPSTTISPTIKPSGKLTPTTKPTPTVKPSPTPKIATPSGLIQSGNETPTLVLLVAGFGLVVFGSWWYRRAV